MVGQEKPHSTGINETKLDSSVNDCYTEIDGYIIIRKDRDLNDGGVALYIDKSTHFDVRDDLNHDNV